MDEIGSENFQEKPIWSLSETEREDNMAKANTSLLIEDNFVTPKNKEDLTFFSCKSNLEDDSEQLEPQTSPFNFNLSSPGPFKSELRYFSPNESPQMAPPSIQLTQRSMANESKLLDIFSGNFDEVLKPNKKSNCLSEATETIRFSSYQDTKRTMHYSTISNRAIQKMKAENGLYLQCRMHKNDQESIEKTTSMPDFYPNRPKSKTM